MNRPFVDEILLGVMPHVDSLQLKRIEEVVVRVAAAYEINPSQKVSAKEGGSSILINEFICSKRVEGCSNKTLAYYQITLEAMASTIEGDIRRVQTEDIHTYLIGYQQKRGAGKVTIDNIRRILSSFFSWLEDEEYIVKNPVRRIHKVKATTRIKNTYSDEDLERMRDGCTTLRDLAIVDILALTGMRIGELVGLDRADVDFSERECRVIGKGDKERIVYFDARTKLHLEQYLASRQDSEHALFATLVAPHNRLSIGAVEARLRKLGESLGIERVHPHKFRRTLATRAINKGMPIEQLQCLLGHQRIDTTLRRAKEPSVTPSNPVRHHQHISAGGRHHRHDSSQPRATPPTGRIASFPDF